MELGEKILLARQEAGLSQRQLGGEVITRNMLSQIEHGTARPSMKTLRYLASRLGKPMSYFLDEEAPPLPGGNLQEAVAGFQKAEAAIAQGKHIYAEELLRSTVCPVPDLERRRLLLLAQIPGADKNEICRALPDVDEELFLRAEVAFSEGMWERCEHLLEAMENHTRPKWQILRGRLYLQQNDYRAAARAFHGAETEFPEETAVYLEQCYREMEDYKQAYFYACKQKK